jgi:hypothetical protein
VASRKRRPAGDSSISSTTANTVRGEGSSGGTINKRKTFDTAFDKALNEALRNSAHAMPPPQAPPALTSRSRQQAPSATVVGPQTSVQLIPLPQGTAPLPGDWSFFPVLNGDDLEHSVQPTDKNEGLHANIFSQSGKTIDVPTSLKMKIARVMKGLPKTERVVALRCAGINKSFVPLTTESAVSSVVVMPLSQYLHLLDFVKSTWPRVLAQLEVDYRSMLKKDKRFRVGNLHHLYVRGGERAVHTMVLWTTSQGDELRLITTCFCTRPKPTYLVSLGYNNAEMGNVGFNPEPLQALATDAEGMASMLGSNKVATKLTPPTSQPTNQQQANQRQSH